MNAATVVRDVVLVGGGHSHALVIRRWAMRPLGGVRLTLVSREVETPYSGMLPGLVAGHYAVGEVHIDLMRLCTLAGVRFVRAEMVALDPERRRVALAGRPALGYDLLSLDTGSTPDLSVPGAREHATPVKPVAGFHARWREILSRVAAEGDGDDGARITLGVVGAGAGGYELIMAMRHALPAARADCHWFLRGARPLDERPEAVARRALAAARRAGVVVHTGFDVVRVREGGIEAADGREVALDETLWCTGATGPAWVRKAGLATDARGFVLTDACLRSVSHRDVFATGDIGTQRDAPSAKAGVFAVRQAPVLYENLRRALLGRPLERYRPQRDFLVLLSGGARSAIASRGPLVVEGGWVWRWKDRIDRAFMNRFAELAPMRPSTLPPVVPNALLGTGVDGRGGAGDDEAELVGRAMRCRGCGAKLGERVLDAVLGSLPVATRADVPAGLAEARDAAVLDPGGRRLVQSVDQLDAIVDDPWLFGRIAALHALGDVATLAAEPWTAQVLATLPPAAPRVARRDLAQLMRGAVDALEGEGCTLVGGHSAEGAALAVGLVVNALAESEEEASAAPSVGDALVLTRALGVGTLFAGLARGEARGTDVDRALEGMQRGNARAAKILRAHEASIMTDVTGFGLLGHLARLLRARAPLAARLDVGRVPLLPGAFALAERGVRSSLWPSARHALDGYQGATALPTAWRYLLCDPQTGGGLLAALPATRADAAVAALRAAGETDAAVIGRIGEGAAHALRPPNGDGGASA